MLLGMREHYRKQTETNTKELGYNLGHRNLRLTK